MCDGFRTTNSPIRVCYYQINDPRSLSSKICVKKNQLMIVMMMIIQMLFIIFTIVAAMSKKNNKKSGSKT